MHAGGDRLGTRIKMWNAQQSWFWLIVSTDCARAATGAAPTEAQAICDANMMVAEMDVRRSASLSLTPQSMMDLASPGHDSIDRLANQWEASFANLKRYLDCHDCVSA
jgi:hypothetical protein